MMSDSHRRSRFATVRIIASFNNTSVDGSVLGRSKGTSYEITDQFFRFYYRMLYPYGEPGDDSERGRLLDRVMAMLPDYNGRSFETVCRQFVRFRLGYRKVGYWRGSDPETRIEENVDIVAIDTYSDDRPTLVAECKCQNRKVGWTVYNDLIRKGRLIHAAKKEFALFSCSGFEDELLANVPEGCSLYTLDDLFPDGSGHRCARPPYLI